MNHAYLMYFPSTSVISTLVDNYIENSNVEGLNNFTEALGKNLLL